jgi:hypothetical protein
MQAKKNNANNCINSVLIVLIGLDDIIDGDNQVALDLELDEGEDVGRQSGVCIQTLKH